MFSEDFDFSFEIIFLFADFDFDLSFEILFLSADFL